MSDNIWIRPEKDVLSRFIKLPSVQTMAKGISVSVRVPESDRPTSLNGGYDRKTGKFIIQFRYDDNERSEETRSTGDENVKFTVGSESKRLQKITVAVDKNEIDVVHLELSRLAPKWIERADDALDSLRNNTKKLSAKLNYELIEELIKTYQSDDRLAQDLEPA